MLFSTGRYLSDRSNRIERLDGVMENAGLPEESYKDSRQEYKKDLERINEKMAKLEDFIFDI